MILVNHAMAKISMSNIYFIQNIVFFSTWRWLASYLQFSFDVFMLIRSVYTGLLVSVQDTRNTAHTTEQLFFFTGQCWLAKVQAEHEPEL